MKTIYANWTIEVDAKCTNTLGRLKIEQLVSYITSIIIVSYILFDVIVKHIQYSPTGKLSKPRKIR